MARMIRKEIKEPDAFQVFAVRAIRWFQAFRKAILGALAGILLAIIVYGGYRYWEIRTNRQASLSYTLAETASQPQGAEERLRQTVADYPRTRAGRLARLHLAGLLREDGKYAEAEGEYRLFLATGGLSPADEELAKRGLAASLAAQKKCQEAYPIWRGILDRGSRFNAEDIYIAIGACYEQEGKPAEALKAYEELNEKYPGSPYMTPRIQARMKEFAQKTQPPKSTGK